jgi:transposase InsO family protein
MNASKIKSNPVGRPPYSDALLYRGYVEVARQRKRQGRAVGWRKVFKALSGWIPLRLVQEALARFKKRDRARERKRREECAERISVKVKDVIWTQDGTHLGRTRDASVEGQVLKDRGSLKNGSLLVGLPACAADVLVLLKTGKSENGILPLVYQTDNDSVYLDCTVQSFLKRERVVHLKSRVCHPWDNGAAERGIRELKYESRLGKGVKLENIEEAAMRFGKAALQLNRYCLRGTKGYISSDRLAQTMPSWYDRIDRETFYEEVQISIKSAVQGLKGNRARKAERDAIYDVLEKYGLIERTRGGRRQRTRE